MWARTCICVSVVNKVLVKSNVLICKSVYFTDSRITKKWVLSTYLSQCNYCIASKSSILLVSKVVNILFCKQYYSISM